MKMFSTTPSVMPLLHLLMDKKQGLLCHRMEGLSVHNEKKRLAEDERFVNTEYRLSFLYRTTIASAATTAGTLCLELSSQPSDYSYFKSDLMSTWAGPLHWKLRDKLSKG